MHTVSVQPTQSFDSCPEFSDGTTITATQKVHVWAVISEEPSSPTRRVLENLKSSNFSNYALQLIALYRVCCFRA